MQVGLFHGPQTPHDGAQVLANINALIGKARQVGASIFVARHTGPKGSLIEPDSPLAQLLPDLAIDAMADTVFEKSRPNCFLGTGLADLLRAASVDELVVAGMKTEYCVDTTCRAAADLGFQPVLVADAHTSMDTPVLSAQNIIDHHNLTLSGPFVKLVSTAECAF
jgi:nicotinamidase-related amidase